MRRLRNREGLGVLAVATTLALATLGTATAAGIGIGESGFYDMSGSDCPSDGHTDPVGALFVGTQAYAANVASQVANHAGWSDGSSSDHWLWVHLGNNQYGCRKTNEQRADHGDLPPSGRYHIRLWWIPASGGDQKKTVGTPHHEDFRWVCFPPSHAVDSNGSDGSGFDRGRHALKDAFIQGGHGVSSEYWGNTANFHQCDGDWAGSDGWGVRITVNHTSG